MNAHSELDSPDAAAALRYHHGDLRGALIVAGRSLLEEGGPRALTLRAAARRANVSHAAPRHHFASLRHFLGDCAADGFAEFDAALRSAADSSAAASASTPAIAASGTDQTDADGAREPTDPAAASDPTDALAAMGAAYVRFAVANRAVFRLMFDCDSYCEHTEALRIAGGRAYDTLVEAVRALPGPVAAAELDYRVASVWSLVHGFAHLTLEGAIGKQPGTVPQPDLLAARAVRDFVGGALGRE